MAKWATGEPPKEVGEYLVTYVYGLHQDRKVTMADRVVTREGFWYWSFIEGGCATDDRIIAWQKCPEPYQG